MLPTQNIFLLLKRSNLFATFNKVLGLCIWDHILQIKLLNVKISFQLFIRLENIKKCFTQKGGIFVLEEFSESKFEIIF